MGLKKDFTSKCWFCEDNLESIKNPDTFKMYKEISRVDAVIGESSVKFNSMNVTIHRCDECQDKFQTDEVEGRKIRDKYLIAAIITAIIGTISFVLNLSGDGQLDDLGVGLFLVVCVVSFLMISVIGYFVILPVIVIIFYMLVNIPSIIFGFLKGEKKEVEKSYLDHPTVKLYEQEGWQINEPIA